jgi:hypothetical protein
MSSKREKERKKERKEKKRKENRKSLRATTISRKVNIPTPKSTMMCTTASSSSLDDNQNATTILLLFDDDDTFGPRLLLSVLATLFAAVMFAFCASMPRSLCLELCS